MDYFVSPQESLSNVGSAERAGDAGGHGKRRQVAACCGSRVLRLVTRNCDRITNTSNKSTVPVDHFTVQIAELEDVITLHSILGAWNNSRAFIVQNE